MNLKNDNMFSLIIIVLDNKFQYRGRLVTENSIKYLWDADYNFKVQIIRHVSLNKK